MERWDVIVKPVSGSESSKSAVSHGEPMREQISARIIEVSCENAQQKLNSYSKVMDGDHGTAAQECLDANRQLSCLSEHVNNLTSDRRDGCTTQIKQMRAQLLSLHFSLKLSTFRHFLANAEGAILPFQKLNFCQKAAKHLLMGSDSYHTNQEKIFNLQLDAIQVLKESNSFQVNPADLQEIKGVLSFIISCPSSTNDQKTKAGWLSTWIENLRT